MLTFNISAQNQETDILTLDDCINIALDRNIELKRSRNSELIARSNKFQSIFELLPSVTAGINYDFFIGTTFDQNAAQQVSATTSTSNPNISASWTLFDGLNNINTRRRRILEYESAEENVKAQELSTRASVLAAYLNVILDGENLKVAEQRVELLENQLERETKRESVGVGNLETVYNFRSQLATEKLNLNTLQNTLQRDKLTLLQAAQIDPTEKDYQISPYEIDEADLLLDIDPFEQVLQESLSSAPSVKSAKASRKASKFQYRAAVGGYMPTISAFGRLGSNFSTNGARNPETNMFEPDATFFEQLDFNQFEYVNFSVSVPIFNRFRTRNNVQIAKLNMHNAELDEQQAILTITNTIQRVYLDLVAAQNTYKSAQENLIALGQSFEFMNKRYETGNTDFYTYLESLNNKNRAEVELVNAKYQIILRQKILDLYRSI